MIDWQNKRRWHGWETWTVVAVTNAAAWITIACVVDYWWLQ